MWHEGWTILSIHNECAPQDSRLVPVPKSDFEVNARKEEGKGRGLGNIGGKGGGGLHLLRQGSAEGCCDITDEGGGRQRHDASDDAAEVLKVNVQY